MENRILPRKLQFLSGSMLKLIAVLAMVLDHSALILASVFPEMGVPFFTLLGRSISVYYIMRKIGRLAFPIFCYLIAEGYCHTRKPLVYMLRLALFAVLSEIPFNLMISGSLFYDGKQNVYVTLLMGVVLLFVFDKVKNNLLKLICMGIVIVLAKLLKADYGLIGVLLIFLLYALRKHPVAQALLAYPFLSGGIAAWCSFGVIAAYNGKRGFASSGFWKYVFYIFYPAHIMILLGVRYFLQN